MMLTPEGSSYEFMDDYVMKAYKEIEEKLPEAAAIMTYTAPGFAGSGASNSAFGRIALVDPTERDRSQAELKGVLNGIFRSMPDARAFASEQEVAYPFNT